MGLVSFLRTVLTGTDNGRAEFTSGPLDAWIAAQGANTSTSNMNAVLAAAVTREFAMQVPAVLRGRNVICSIATLPLVTVDRTSRDRVESPLLTQIDPQVPNLVTLAQTLEDLIFDGIAWWKVTKYGPGPAGFPLNARHLDSARVSVKPPYPGAANRLPSGVDPSSVVWVDGQPVNGTTLVRFDSPNPPLLTVGKRTIKRAALLDAAASMYAEDPRPLDYLTPAEDADPDMDDVQDVMDKWLEARRKRATGWVPSTLTYHEVDSPTPADLQLVELQQRTDLALANMLGLDPEDVGVSTTSRTYANATDRRRDKINDTLAPYMLAITSRLSMNDVSRRTEQVMFDLTDYLKADPATQAEVAGIYLDRQVLSVAEVRADLGRPDIPVEPAPVRSARPAVAQTNAREGMVQTYSDYSGPTDGQTFRFDDDEDVHTFRADAGRRTVSGMLLPFGRVGRNAHGRWRFAAGSVDWPRSAVSRVKLNREHDRRDLLGAAKVIRATSDGIATEFRVARGPAGDQALSEAEDEVLDGLSAEVDILDYTADPENEGVYLVTRARLTGAALTGTPAFDDARLTSVAASNTQEGTAMTVADPGTIDSAATPAATPTTQAPAPETAHLSREDVAAIVSAELSRRAQPAATPVTDPAPAPATATYFGSDFRAAAQAALTEAFASMNLETRETVNPNRETAAAVREPLPYVFDRGGNLLTGDHDFSSDIVAMGKAKDQDGSQTDAGRRVMALLKAAFATATTDVDELNPAIQRPDMYVDQKDYRTPLWDIVNKGALPNGVQPFTFPKFASASGLVGDHTEGTEPSVGSFVTTGQTINPTGISGKAEINREVWDMGGNPQTSGLIWNQMRRGWREGLESATATFLNTLTAAVDITITAGAADDVLADVWDDALAELQFTRGYDYSAFAVEKVLYKRFTVATDSTGRRLFPILNGMNNNGSAASRFRTLDLSGVTGVPAWALASTSGAPNNSWLFDPMHVHGWATPPQELTFDVRVKSVDIGIFGYKAFANSDIAAVRQVIYDLVP